MTRKQRRLVLIGSAMAVLAIAVGLVLNAMRDSIVFFSTPSEVAEKHIAAGKRFRLGGMVLVGSVTALRDCFPGLDAGVRGESSPPSLK